MNNIESQEPDTLWGAEEIGKVIGRNKNQTFYLLKRNRLPGVKKVGKLYAGSRKILRNLQANISAA